MNNMTSIEHLPQAECIQNTHSQDIKKMPTDHIYVILTSLASCHCSYWLQHSSSYVQDTQRSSVELLPWPALAKQADAAVEVHHHDLLNVPQFLKWKLVSPRVQLHIKCTTHPLHFPWWHC